MDELDKLVDLIPSDSVWDFVKYLIDEKGFTVDTTKTLDEWKELIKEFLKQKCIK